MNTKQRLATFVVVLALAGGAALAAAQPGPGRGPRGGDGWERLAERLDLNDAQKQAIAAIRDAHRARQLEGRKQIVQLEAQLHTVLLADAPDEAAALKLVGQIGELRARQAAERVKMRLAVRKELTPEQRNQFILMEDQLGKGGRGGHRLGGRHPFGGGPGAGCGFPGDGPGHRGGRPGRGGPSGRDAD